VPIADVSPSPGGCRARRAVGSYLQGARAYRLARHCRLQRACTIFRDLADEQLPVTFDTILIHETILSCGLPVVVDYGLGHTRFETCLIVRPRHSEDRGRDRDFPSLLGIAAR